MQMIQQKPRKNLWIKMLAVLLAVILMVTPLAVATPADYYVDPDMEAVASELLLPELLADETSELDAAAVLLTASQAAWLDLIDYDNAVAIARDLTEYPFGSRLGASFRMDMTVEYLTEFFEAHGIDTWVHEFDTRDPHWAGGFAGTINNPGANRRWNNGFVEIDGSRFMLYGPAHNTNTVYAWVNDATNQYSVSAASSAVVLDWPSVPFRGTMNIGGQGGRLSAVWNSGEIVYSCYYPAWRAANPTAATATNAATAFPAGSFADHNPSLASVNGNIAIVRLGSGPTPHTPNMWLPTGERLHEAAAALQNAGATGVIFQSRDARTMFISPLTPFYDDYYDRGTWTWGDSVMSPRRFANVTAAGNTQITIPVGITAYWETNDVFSSLAPNEPVDVFMQARSDGQNVIAEIPATVGNPGDAMIIYLGNHPDSVESCPGFNDTAITTALQMEMMRAIAEYVANGGQLVNTIRFGGWDFEEHGLLGARYYAYNMSVEDRHHRQDGTTHPDFFPEWGARFWGNFNMDMIASGQPELNYMHVNITTPTFGQGDATALEAGEVPHGNLQYFLRRIQDNERLRDHPAALAYARQFTIWANTELAARQLAEDGRHADRQIIVDPSHPRFHGNTVHPDFDASLNGGVGAVPFCIDHHFTFTWGQTTDQAAFVQPALAGVAHMNLSNALQFDWRANARGFLGGQFPAGWEAGDGAPDPALAGLGIMPILEILYHKMGDTYDHNFSRDRLEVISDIMWLALYHSIVPTGERTELPPRHEITFDLANGTYSGGTVDVTRLANHGGPILEVAGIPTPILQNHTFLGWRYVGQEAQTPYFTRGQVRTMRFYEPMTFVAQFVENHGVVIIPQFLTAEAETHVDVYITPGELAWSASVAVLTANAIAPDADGRLIALTPGWHTVFHRAAAPYTEDFHMVHTYFYIPAELFEDLAPGEFNYKYMPIENSRRSPSFTGNAVTGGGLIRHRGETHAAGTGTANPGGNAPNAPALMRLPAISDRNSPTGNWTISPAPTDATGNRLSDAPTWSLGSALVPFDPNNFNTPAFRNMEFDAYGMLIGLVDEARSLYAFSSLAEVDAFYNELLASPVNGGNTHRFNVGFSPHNFTHIPDPYYFWNDVMVFTSTDLSDANCFEEAGELVRNNGRPTFFTFTGVHGHEQSSCEGVLAVMYALAATPWGAEVVEDMNFVVFRGVNATGNYQMIRGTSQVLDESRTAPGRPAQRGTDGNRDFVIHATQEIAQLQQVWLAFMPEVTADGHEIGGINYDADGWITTGAMGDDNQLQMTATLDVDGRAVALGARMLQQTFDDGKDAGVRLGYYNVMIVNASVGNHFYGMWGGLSTIIETRGQSSQNLLRRSYSSYVIYRSKIEFIRENADEVHDTIAEVRADLIVGGRTYDPIDPADSTTLIVRDQQGGSVTAAHPRDYRMPAIPRWHVGRGGQYVLATNQHRIATTRDVQLISRPTAYIVPLELEWNTHSNLGANPANTYEQAIADLFTLLRGHGIAYYILDAGAVLPAQQFYVSSATITPRDNNFATGLRQRAEVSFDVPVLFIPMDQVAGHVIAQLMTPDMRVAMREGATVSLSWVQSLQTDGTDASGFSGGGGTRRIDNSRTLLNCPQTMNLPIFRFIEDDPRTFVEGAPVEAGTMAAWAGVNLNASYGYPAIINPGTFNPRWDADLGLLSDPGNARLRFIADGTARTLNAVVGGINAGTGFDGLAGNAYWITELSTVGHTNITVEWNFRSPAQAPRDWQLQYRVGDSGSWNDADAPIVVVNPAGNPANINEAPHFSRTLPASAEGHASLQLRWLMTTNTAVNGNPIGAVANHQIGNVHIRSSDADVPVDRDALAQAIAEAEALDEDDFTAETWADLEDALAEAKRVFADENATQDEIDDAYRDLRTALNALERVPVEAGTIAAWANAALGADRGYPAMIGPGTFNPRWDADLGLASNPGNARLRFMANNAARVLNIDAGGINAGNNLQNLAENAYWITELSTVGHANITVEWNFRSAGMAPRDWQLQYSTDGSAWNDVGDPIVIVNPSGNPANVNVAPHFSRTLPASAEGRTSLQLRWLMTSNTNVNGGAVAPVGVHQIGNVRIWSSDEDDDILWGDVDGNGVVNMLDVIRLRQYLAGDPVEIHRPEADADGNGLINMLDVIRLQQYLAGDPVTLGPPRAGASEAIAPMHTNPFAQEIAPLSGPVLSVAPITGSPGEIVNVEIWLSGASGAHIVTGGISLGFDPAVLELVDNGVGRASVTMPNPGLDVPMPPLITNNPFRLNVESLASNDVALTDGLFMSVQFRIRDDAVLGSSALTLSNPEFFDLTGTGNPIDTVDNTGGTVTVAPATSPVFSVMPVTGSPGEIVSVEIWVSGASGANVVTGGISLGFDPAILEPVDNGDGRASVTMPHPGLDVPMPPLITNNPLRLNVESLALNDVAVTDGLFISVQFRIRDDAVLDESDITLSNPEFFSLAGGGSSVTTSVDNDGGTITVIPPTSPTVSVSAGGTLTASRAGTVNFPVTTTGIAAGSHPVTVANLPGGVTAPATLTIAANGTGTLTLTGSTATTAGTHTNLTLTIDGVTSNSFTLRITAVSQPPIPPQQPPTDPAEYEKHLAYMFGHGGNFRPRANITRAEAATILARTQLLDFEDGVDELPPGMTSFNAFSDVRPGDWFFYYVAWAYDAGLIQGYAGRFRPNDPITREELAAILARTTTLRTGTTSFSDAATISNWAMPYVYTVYREGWMVGDQGTFRPADNIIRAEVATAMNRILGRLDSRPALYAADVEHLYRARGFYDVADGAWYFPSVLAAANDHRLTRDSDDAIDWKYILR